MSPQCGGSPRAAGGRSAGRWARLGAAVLLSVAALNVISDATLVASAADCADAEVVFARGTDEPKGMGQVGDAFVDSLREQAVGMNIATYAVNYDAGKLQLGSGDGAKDAISHIKSAVASCPDTKIVLGGYSQGANVVNIVAGNPIVGIAWGAALPSSLAGNVAAIATFGNVANRVRYQAAVGDRAVHGEGDRPVQPRRSDLSRGPRQRMERAHQGLCPGLHHAGRGFRLCQVVGRDQPGGARFRAGAGIRAVSGVCITATGIRPHAAWIRYAVAGIRSVDVGVQPIRCGGPALT